MIFIGRKAAVTWAHQCNILDLPGNQLQSHNPMEWQRICLENTTALLKRHNYP